MENFWRILSYAKPYKFQITMAVIFNILMVLFSVLSLLIIVPVFQFLLNELPETISEVPWSGIGDIKEWAKAKLDFWLASKVEANGKWPVLKIVLIIGAVAFIFKNLTRYVASIFLIYMKNGVERDLKKDLHRKVLNLPIAAFSNQRKGDIITRMTNDVQEVQWAVLGSLEKLAQDPLMIIVTLILLVIASPQLTLFAAIFIPVVGFLIARIGNSLKKSSTLLKAEQGRTISYLEEHINGLTIIKSYVAENSAAKRFNNSINSVFRYANQMMFRNALASPASEGLGSLVIIGIMAYGGYLIVVEESLQPSMFIGYIALFYQIIAPLKNLGKASADIKRGDASAARIFEILDTVNPLEDRLDAKELIDFTREIKFENVSFAYDDQVVVKNFNLTITKGKTVALVGQSGSGKSTIANLINRFYDVSEGSIRIDGVDIRDIKKASLRKMIGFISQEAILFNGSIVENIRFGMHDRSEAQIKQATQYANAEEFVDKLDGQYDYNIGDQGRKLSGGQRQRLTIARSILKNPPIMVLDEATSALDSESEKLVQDAIDKIMKGRTALIIAHRLSTIQHADEILVMKHGEIIESGNHESLIRKRGEYYNLVKLQEI